jgi:charged multivesicular body protein 6
MGGVFSKKGKQPKAAPKGTVSSTDRAILDLKNARDRLSKYRSKLNIDQKKLLVKAKTLQNDGDTSMAIKLMQLRKHKLNEAENVENQLLNVLQLVETIQSTQNENEILKSLSSGKHALEALHKEMSVDDVLNLMDDIKEQNEIENEINNILIEGVTLTADDESEIERELAAMMAKSQGDKQDANEQEKEAESQGEQQSTKEKESVPAEDEPTEKATSVENLPEVPTTTLPVENLPEVPTTTLPEPSQEPKKVKQERVALAS